MKKLQYIEIGRGIAALLVVLRHATRNAPAFYGHTPFANFFYFGNAGIDFFFVLSGFIIYYIHSDDKATWQNIKKYVAKRLIRIYPVFLLISTVLLGSYLLFPDLANRSNTIDIEYLATSFLLLPSSEPRLLGVSWTLVHEIFFYTIFVLLILNRKIGMVIFAFWAFIIVIYNLFSEDKSFPLDFYLSRYNLEFIFGILAAFLIKSDHISFLKKHLSYVISIGLIIFLLNGINADYTLIKLNTFWVTMIYGGASFMLILGLSILPERKNENRVFKIFLLLGSASYAIYLIHNPLLSVLHRIVKKIDLVSFMEPNMIFLLLVFICVIVGILLHLYIEKPTLGYLRKKFL